MGAEYYCYASDITCSFPSNGKFTEDQKMIYDAVWAANRAVFNAIRPGVNWVDMHALSYKTMLTKLKEGGLLQGNVEEMMKVDIINLLKNKNQIHIIIQFRRIWDPCFNLTVWVI